MKTILMIEDDPGIVLLFKQTLQSEGHQINVVSDNEAGLSMIPDLQPDLVLLDLGLNGVETVRRLRSERGTQKLPIIALANSYDKKSVAQAWTAGITNCLYVNSCTPRSIVAIVAKAFGPVPSKIPPVGLPMTETVPLIRPASISSTLEFQASMRKSFLQEALEITDGLRTRLQALAKADTSVTRQAKIMEIHQTVRATATKAAMAELPNLAQMATALDALLKELHGKPESLNHSALRTIAATIDFLAELARQPEVAAANATHAANILAVDDEPLSRRAVSQALDGAGLKCVSVESPEIALGLLGENAFDLVILDIDMPGMNGIELCKQLRLLPKNKKSPVIFVTSHGDFEHRAQSALAGGNDLIAKPFLFMELAVKALAYIQKGQMAKAPAATP